MYGRANARVAMVTAHYIICTSHRAILDVHIHTHTYTPLPTIPTPSFCITVINKKAPYWPPGSKSTRLFFVQASLISHVFVTPQDSITGTQAEGAHHGTRRGQVEQLFTN